MADKHIPAVVLALARCIVQLGPLPPQPCAWKEYPDAWVVVFDDGRKIRFTREPAGGPASAPAPSRVLRPGRRKLK